MRPTMIVSLVLSRATKAGKKRAMWTRMSSQLQWLLTMATGSTVLLQRPWSLKSWTAPSKDQTIFRPLAVTRCVMKFYNVENERSEDARRQAYRVR
jgi:hypothetical protein